MLPEHQIFELGDEPDRSYDLAAPARRGRSAAAVNPVIEQPTAPLPPAPRPLDPWDGSIMRGLYVPAALVLASVAIAIPAISLESEHHRGILHGVRYVAVDLVVRTAMLFLTCMSLGRWLDMGFGRIVPFLLKTCAIASCWGMIVAAILLLGRTVGQNYDHGTVDFLAGNGVAGTVAVSAITLLAYFGLFLKLFDWPSDAESSRFILIAWGLQVLVAGVALHLLLDPPAATPHYVDPKHPFHITVGN